MAELHLSSVYGGMNNILQPYKLHNEQCSLLKNIEYFDKEKKFQGSKRLISTNIKSNRLFEVIYNGKRYLVSICDDGLYFYSDFYNNENEDFKISTPVKPLLDIVYNEDGVVYSYSNKVFLYNNYGLSEKLNNLSVYFYAKSLFTDANIGSIEYYNNKIYTIPYSHIDGYAVKCFNISDNEEIKSVNIVSSPTFTKSQGCLFMLSYDNLGLIAGSNHLDSSYSGGYQIVDLNIKQDNGIIGVIGYDANSHRNQYSMYKRLYNFGIYYYNNLPANITAPVDKSNLSASLQYTDNLLINGEYKPFIISAACFYNAVNDPNNATVSTYNCEIRVKVVLNGNTFNKYLTFNDTFIFNSRLTNAPYLTFLNKIFYYDKKIYIFNCVEDVFIINLYIDLSVLDLEVHKSKIQFDDYAGDNYIYDVTQNNNTFYILKNDKTPMPDRKHIVYQLTIGNLFSDIRFLSVQNSRLILGQNSSLYYSGVGDFKNWDIDTDGDALYLEVGYKDIGIIVAGKVFGDNIIVFKDNGYIYRVSGSYPNWVVSKIAETSKLTSNIFDYQGVLIFGTVTGLKKLNPPNYYGEMLVEDFQNSIIANNVLNISMSENRKTLVFCSEDYVFEYIINLNIFVVYQAGIYKQHLEYYNNTIEYYEDYFISSGNNIFKSSKTELNTVTVERNLIQYQNSIVIKSITLFTDELLKDTEITIYLYGNVSFKRVLKKGISKHKIFITKRLRQFQLKYIHAGNIFINSIIIEYINVTGV